MLSQGAVVELVKDRLFPAWLTERDRLDRIDWWYRWRQEDIRLPRKATTELKRLAELSKTPWLALVVTSVSQCLAVDGFRSPLYPETRDAVETAEPVGPWRTWQANDLDHRQTAIHRAALAYGQSFMKVLPGADSQGRPTSVMRGVSPRKMYAVFADPAEDDWPMYTLQVEVQPDKSNAIRVLDEKAEYYLSADSGGTKVEYIEHRIHDSGVCPVVRYTNMLDLDGRSAGEVEPFIPAAARINKTAYDRLVTQHFSSWKVRTVTGMAEPDDDEQASRVKLRVAQDEVLISEDPDTKFGTLDGSPLDGFISAWESDIEALAAVTQTPTHELTGKLINLSAEALAAARASLTQKAAERQKSFGKSHVQALRLSAAQEGNLADANDVMSRVTWQDMSVRSLAQAVDALGKAATMLQIPVEALWARIPGVEKADVDEWAQMAAAADPAQQMLNQLTRQAAPTVPPPAPLPGG